MTVHPGRVEQNRLTVNCLLFGVFITVCSKQSHPQTFEQKRHAFGRQSVDCVVLAAGLSSRMGHWKMQLPLGDQSNGLFTILDHSLNNALSFCQRVILVTGYRSKELEQRYQGQPNIALVYNPNYRDGLTASVLTGLAQVQSDYAFITHGDLPFLNKTVFSSLWAARKDCAIFPVYQSPSGHSQQGHPALIPASMIPGLLNADTKRPMKQLLAHNCIHIPVTSPEIIRDIDTPSTYFSATGISLGSVDN